MDIATSIGEVRDIKPGQVAFSGVEALNKDARGIYGGATIYDRPLQTCLRLEGQTNGVVLASLHDNALENVMANGDTFSQPRPARGSILAGRSVTRSPGTPRSRYTPDHQASVERLLLDGPLRLEITDLTRTLRGGGGREL